MRTVGAILFVVSLIAGVLAGSVTPVVAQSTVVLGGLDLTDYCEARHGGDAYAELTKAQIGPNAANDNWVCTTESLSLFHSLDIARACKWQYQDGSVVAVARSNDDAYSWQCQRDPAVSPTPAPLALRGPSRTVLPTPGAVPSPEPSAPTMCNNLVVTVDIGKGEAPTEGDDVIRGTAGNDVIDALGGSDVICALQGNDTIDGGDGFDRVFAGTGDDTVRGGAGNDLLIGGAGDDTIIGGNGNDRIQGGGGIDVLSGDGGSDRVAGGDGNDMIYGGSHSDWLYGNLGRDQLFGEGGNDALRGGAWKDLMNGGPGNNDGCTLNDPGGLVETRVECEVGVFGFDPASTPPADQQQATRVQGAGTVSSDVAVQVSAVPAPTGANSSGGISLNSQGSGIALLVLDLPSAPDGHLPLVQYRLANGETGRTLGRYDEAASTLSLRVTVGGGSFGGTAKSLQDLGSDTYWGVMTDPNVWWSVFKEDTIDPVSDFAAQRLGGRTDPPECGDEPEWVSREGFNISSVHSCVRAIDDDTAEIIIKSNRFEVFRVGVPAGTVSQKSEGWGRFGAELDSQPFSEALGFDIARERLLMPGETLRFEIDRPVNTRTVSVRVRQENMEIAINGLSILLGLAGDVDAEETATVLLALAGCEKFGETQGPGALTWKDITELAEDCVVPSLATQKVFDGMIELGLENAGANATEIEATKKRLQGKYTRVQSGASYLLTALSALRVAVAIDDAIRRIAEPELVAWQFTEPAKTEPPEVGPAIEPAKTELTAFGFGITIHDFSVSNGPSEQLVLDLDATIENLNGQATRQYQTPRIAFACVGGGGYVEPRVLSNEEVLDLRPGQVRRHQSSSIILRSALPDCGDRSLQLNIVFMRMGQNFYERNLDYEEFGPSADSGLILRFLPPDNFRMYSFYASTVLR